MRVVDAAVVVDDDDTRQFDITASHPQHLQLINMGLFSTTKYSNSTLFIAVIITNSSLSS